MDAVKPQAKEAETLRKELQSIAKDFPELERVVLKGEDGEVAFRGDKGNRTVTDMKGLIAALKKVVGLDGVLKMINIPIGEAEQYLGEIALNQFVSYKESTRTLD